MDLLAKHLSYLSDTVNRTPYRISTLKWSRTACVGAALRELQFHLVHEAPAPIFARFQGPHDGMLRRMEVLCRVLVFRRVATTHVPALQAQAQMHPTITHLQALLAAAGVRLHVLDVTQMFATRHINPLSVLRQITMRERHCHRTFSHSGRAALHRSMAYVARCE